ncbi:DUF6766 family protein [Motilibacter aurantiacus]|uniref:DUF6766 family protein n=1 Tax=Motilibacter aurantiacus TaxID=2714955 RepID=UPI00140DDA61|nr:DUF6766 family protein [Motilibacter aurantiacus]NHC46600.1 hypothetical protein [Motilibacter aurantiacus]
MSDQKQERGFLRDNSLSIAFGLLFLITLVLQALAGWAQENNELRQAELDPVSLLHYVTTASFGADVLENWQSEYLQFFLFLFGTVWLIQRGSPESKEPGKEGPESDEEQQLGAYIEDDSPAWARAGGWRAQLFSRSLGVVMALIFLASWAGQSVAGWSAYNEEQLRDLAPPVSWGGYVLGADFWSRTLQNWQSELLAVGSFAVLAIFLRQRGSSQSKPVGAAHASTGIEG